MEDSLVISRVLSAFNVARFDAASQPTLASLLELNEPFFSKIHETLLNIPKAPDVFICSQSGVVDATFSFEHANLVSWICEFPEGVAWPITMAAPLESGLLAAPMRLLVMVPLQIECTHQHLVGTIENSIGYRFWKPTVGDLVAGETSAIFLGLFCTEDGYWEYPPIAWVVSSDGVDIQEGYVIGVPQLLSHRAKVESISIDEALTSYVHDYLLEEIGCVLLSQDGG